MPQQERIPSFFNKVSRVPTDINKKTQAWGRVRRFVDRFNEVGDDFRPSSLLEDGGEFFGMLGWVLAAVLMLGMWGSIRASAQISDSDPTLRAQPQAHQGGAPAPDPVGATSEELR